MSKYGNIKFMGFDSKKESKRFTELSLMEKAGLIKNLRRQVEYELIPRQEYKGKFAERPVKYKADFVYEVDGEEVVEDVKGFRTDIYRLKRKLMLYLKGIKIKET